MYHLGIIGNCQISALIDSTASINWLCMPRPDSRPLFGSLLDPQGGNFHVRPVKFLNSTQRYRTNTNILETLFSCEGGIQVKVTDFCPRFEQYGRMYRPASIMRIIEPIGGSTHIKAQCLPVDGWSMRPPEVRRANSHFRYKCQRGIFRVVTNMPLTYFADQTPFLLQEPIYFALLWDQPLEADLRQTCLDFLEKTENYWQKWVKHCSLPTMFQEQVIRSALTLKIHCYEDTGAILAATTTSLPETIGGERNWDYRFCWLRDAFFVLSAFRNLGHFEETEGFLKFLMNIIDFEKPMAPVYTLDHKLPLPETIIRQWSGFKKSAPVRENNAAAAQKQNDVYGEMLLSLAPIFIDERFQHLRTDQLEKAVAWLVENCCRSVGASDAGLWEIRNAEQEHSFVNLVSWAGLNRIRALVENNKLSRSGISLLDVVQYERLALERLSLATKDGVLRNGPNDQSLDASLLLMPILRYPDMISSSSTVDAICKNLNMGDKYSSFLFRYLRKDDFGTPSSSFVICSFWLAEALGALGSNQTGAVVFTEALRAANNLGLFAEHYDPKTKLQFGNFPQAYSHVGLINAAFRLSPGWTDIL